MMNQYRHGDVFIHKVRNLPEGATQLTPENTPQRFRGSKPVLAFGEVTGHAHVVDEGLLFEKDGQLWFRVPKKTTVKHEEHAQITLPKGIYHIVIQREYTPEAVRRVLD